MLGDTTGRQRLVAVLGVLIVLIGAYVGTRFALGTNAGVAVGTSSPVASLDPEDALPTPVVDWQPEDEPTPTPASDATPLPTAAPTATPIVQPGVAASPTPTPVGPADVTTSVLLMGYGGPGHPGSYLTDTIILAVLNQTRKTTVLLSLPRDIWVSLPIGQNGTYWNKLNTAYAYGVLDAFPSRPARYRGANGGGNLAKDVVGQILDYSIQSYAALDFETFRRAVDEVGGIDVDVTRSFSAESFRFEVGKQHMDGTTALAFARAREVLDNPAEASDFARSRRQRQILGAFMSRLRSPSGLLHLFPLLSLAREGIDTDYQFPPIGELTSLVRDSGGYRVVEGALTTSNYLRSATGPNGTYILLPKAGSGQWGEVRAYLKSLLAE